LLRKWGLGENTARDALIERLYPELEQIALARLRSERNSSISTGDLINDAVLRLIALKQVAIEDRNHFIALSSTLMRNILVDRARAKNRDKRRHDAVELNSRIEGEQPVDLIELNTALTRLGAFDEELVRLAEMRYFGGMTLAEAGKVLGVSEATAKRRWFVARAWLADALQSRLGDD